MELSADVINEVMQQDGPTVQAVILRSDGSIEQVEMDTTPRLNRAADVLGGNPTFIGQYTKLSVVILCVRVPAETAPVNLHKLQSPFKTVRGVKGDILMLRMDDEGVPQDFTKDEWERFLAEDIHELEEEIDMSKLQLAPEVEEEEFDEDDEEDEDFELEDDEDLEGDGEDDDRVEGDDFASKVSPADESSEMMDEDTRS